MGLVNALWDEASSYQLVKNWSREFQWGITCKHSKSSG